MPDLLAAAPAVRAIIALALALTSPHPYDAAPRPRAPQTSGFTHRQLITTVASQATVVAIILTIIGIPIEIGLGHQLWILFAHEISAVPRPAASALTITLVAVGAPVVANLIAAIPGRQAARTRTAATPRCMTTQEDERSRDQQLSSSPTATTASVPLPVWPFRAEEVLTHRWFWAARY
jgi:hypothetical protein